MEIKKTFIDFNTIVWNKNTITTEALGEEGGNCSPVKKSAFASFFDKLKNEKRECIEIPRQKPNIMYTTLALGEEGGDGKIIPNFRDIEKK